MNAFARVTKHPSAILLVVQLLSVMAYPFMEDTAVGRAAFGVLGVVVLGVAVWAVRSTPALTWVAGLLGVPVLVLTILEGVWPHNSDIHLVSGILHAAFYAYTAYALKCVLDPLTPNNSGSLRPITVTAPEGTIVNATRPAPVWARHLTGHYLPFVVFGALAKVLPDRIIADSGAPGWSVYFKGVDPASRRRFVRMYFMTGGYGARPGSDGPSCLAFPTNVSNTPVEAFEASTPVLITQKELIQDSGGPGRYRGGLGQRIAFRSVSDDPLIMTIRHERVQNPARGLLGGEPGRAGRDLLNGAVIPSKTIQTLVRGDEVCFETPGGGGLFSPGDRPAAAIERDRRLGLIGGDSHGG